MKTFRQTRHWDIIKANRISMTTVFLLFWKMTEPYLKKTPNLDSPVRVSISFGVQPQQPLPAEETVDQPDAAPEMEEPLTIPQAQKLEQPRRRHTPPQYITAQIPDSAEESDEYVEVTTAPRRSIKIQEQHTNRLTERLLEVAGQQLQRIVVLNAQTKDKQSQPEISWIFLTIATSNASKAISSKTGSNTGRNI